MKFLPVIPEEIARGPWNRQKSGLPTYQRPSDWIVEVVEALLNPRI